MPRHGNTRKSNRRSNGHKMHRRGRVARRIAKLGKGRGGSGWGRWAA